jgi:hypothetical protein
MFLNPNCSEIICRLPTLASFKRSRELLESCYKETHRDFRLATNTYPNGALETFIAEAKRFLKVVGNISEFPELGFVDNIGGGGHFESVEASWKVAQLYVWGMFKDWEAANEFDDKLDCNERIIIDACKACLNNNNIDAKCSEYVRRVIGECEGISKETYKGRLQKMLEEAENVHKPKLQRDHMQAVVNGIVG